MSNFSALKPASGSVDGQPINPSSIGATTPTGSITSSGILRAAAFSTYNYPNFGTWFNGNGYVSQGYNIAGSYFGWWDSGGNGLDQKLYAVNGAIQQRSGATPQEYQLFATYTSSTNYERGSFKWDSGAFVIGTEKGSGGGLATALALATDGEVRVALGESGGVELSTWFKCDVTTVATLPVGISEFAECCVSDALAPSVGSTVAGGGSALAKVIYNGSAWKVSVVL